MYFLLYAVCAVIIFFAFGAFFSRNLRIREFNITGKKAEKLNGFKIVLLADLHGRFVGDNQDKLVNAILEQKPNLIIAAGDMVDAYDKNANASAILTERLARKCDVIAVRGNHFYKADENVQKQMERAFDLNGVVSLKNERKILKFKDNAISIDGYDDPFSSKEYKTTRKKEQLKRNRIILDNVINNVLYLKPTNDYRIALCHRPTDVDLFEKAGYDLMLAGHTHGGQWALPFGIEILGDEAKLFPKKSMQSGLHFHNKMPLIITLGIGYSNIKLRTFLPPEIVVINFV